MTPRERADAIVSHYLTGIGEDEGGYYEDCLCNEIEAAIAEAMAQERERCAAIASHAGLPEIAIAILEGTT